MLKQLLPVSLVLIPVQSLASTSGNSLSETKRDAFDGVDENPALINREDKKSLARISKAGSAQLLSNVSGFGVGIQVNTLTSTAADAAGVNTNEFTSAANTLRAAGMPVQLTAGGLFGKSFWGISLQHENAKISGVDTVEKYSPGFSKNGLRAGIANGELQASAGYLQNAWSLATTSTVNSAGGLNNTPLPTGISNQTQENISALVRFKTPALQWFAKYEDFEADAVVYNQIKNEKTNLKRLLARRSYVLGGERSFAMPDGISFHNQGWLRLQNTTINLSLIKNEERDLSLNSAHGVEYAPAAWAVLRAGVRATLWSSTEKTLTLYNAENQSGGMVPNSNKSTYTFRRAAAPTTGLGLKFGNVSVDATLAQNGTGNIGFDPNNFLGEVELTAQF